METDHRMIVVMLWGGGGKQEVCKSEVEVTISVPKEGTTNID